MAAEERDVRVAAHDDRRLLLGDPLQHLGAQAWAVERDVQEKHREHRLAGHAHVDRDAVGQAVLANVDVAAHRDERRHRAQRLEHREIADVARVKDVMRRELAHQLDRARVRLAVRVGHRHDPQAVRRKLDRLARLHPPRRRRCSRSHAVTLLSRTQR